MLSMFNQPLESFTASNQNNNHNAMMMINSTMNAFAPSHLQSAAAAPTLTTGLQQLEQYRPQPSLAQQQMMMMGHHHHNQNQNQQQFMMMQQHHHQQNHFMMMHHQSGS